VLTARQELVLRKVVEAHQATGVPVGSKALALDDELDCGPSTIRAELAILEEQGLLAHPHTSAGRVPTDHGRRFYVDRLLPARPVNATKLDLPLVRRELDEAMRATTETLAQVTDLMAIVSAPAADSATVRHVEVLLLQAQVVVTVVITSTGGVTRRISTFDAPVDAGLVIWAGEYLAERLVGHGLGSRMVAQRLADPSLSGSEQRFLEALGPALTDLQHAEGERVYVEGAARLLGADRLQDLSQINELVATLERRVTLLGALRAALGTRDVLVRIGTENELPALQSLALVAAGYGLPARQLGTVSVIGPLHMDYGASIATVRDAALQLSRYVEAVYER
jgi:heat-inducible transcriptional repressor